MEGGGRPYKASKGVILIAVWKDVLYQYSAKWRNLNHWRGSSLQKQHRYVSRLRFTTSVWPSVSKWYAELYFSIVPWTLNTSFQKLLKKMGSLSEMIELGTPWSRHISVENVIAKSFAVNFVGKAMKCTNLERRSQMTQTVVCPIEFGKWVMNPLLDHPKLVEEYLMDVIILVSLLASTCFVDRWSIAWTMAWPRCVLLARATTLLI